VPSSSSSPPFRTGALADNAQYWLAGRYYVTKDFDSALKVVPHRGGSLAHPRASSPMRCLKIGFCNYELKRWRPRASLAEGHAHHAECAGAKLRGPSALTAWTRKGIDPPLAPDRLRINEIFFSLQAKPIARLADRLHPPAGLRRCAASTCRHGVRLS